MAAQKKKTAKARKRKPNKQREVTAESFVQMAKYLRNEADDIRQNESSEETRQLRRALIITACAHEAEAERLREMR